MRNKPAARCGVAAVLGLLAIQGCTQFVAGDPASPAAWVYRLPLLPRWPWENLSVYGGPGDSTYLGCLRCSGSWVSLDDPHGRFRAASATSIFNKGGMFGNPSSNYSPCNRHGTSPPVVFTSNGLLLGRLTINTDLPDAVQLPSLRTWIASACASADFAEGTEKGYPVPGVPQDRAEGSQSTGKAAGAGNAGGLVRLGRVSFTGGDARRDDTLAAQRVRKAAEEGDAEAQQELGEMYANGRGVPQDDAQAVTRLRSAAEQGATLAQCDLGKRYADGRGVPINLGEAFMWATIAATLSAGDGWQNCIDLRDRLAARMTPAQTTAAQNRARGWLAAFERRKK
jgi:hypothetical protein